ncbi:MAG TPA: hypothetical protein VJC16_04345 [Candidatus Nanoarchaeia archaeon]|nr:hypothetical protein [Candidatus Nanoarchaeia archaeon]
MVSLYQRYTPIPNKRVKQLLDASNKERLHVLTSFARNQLMPGTLLHGFAATLAYVAECLRYDIDINGDKTRKTKGHLNSKHTIDVTRLLKHCDVEHNIQLATIVAALFHDDVEDGRVEEDILKEHLSDVARKIPLSSQRGVTLDEQRSAYLKVASDAVDIVKKLSDPFYRNLAHIHSQVTSWGFPNQPLQEQYPDLSALFTFVMGTNSHTVEYSLHLQKLAAPILSRPDYQLAALSQGPFPRIKETLETIMTTSKDYLPYLWENIYEPGQDRKPRRIKLSDRSAQNLEQSGLPVPRVLLSLVKNFANLDFACRYINRTTIYDGTLVTLKNHLIYSTLEQVISPHLRLLRPRLTKITADLIKAYVKRYVDTHQIQELTDAVTPNDVMRNTYLLALKGFYPPLIKLEGDNEAQYRHFLLFRALFTIYAREAQAVHNGKHHPQNLFNFDWKDELPAKDNGKHANGGKP